MTIEGGPSKVMITAGWSDVPHLTEDAKRDLLRSTPPYLRAARSKGIPSLGAGAIYPIPLEEVICAPFRIPAYWKRGYAMDVGWNRTAALWGAMNPEDHIIYLFAEYYRGQAVPSVHAKSVQLRGEWMRGAMDPAARGRSQDEGRQLFATYEELGLHLVPANNAVESGLYEVWQRLETGRLRIFSTLSYLQAEYRLYRRDDKGHVVKKNDHLMDCKRYLVNTWDQIASVQPVRGRMGGGVADERAGY